MPSRTDQGEDEDLEQKEEELRGQMSFLDHLEEVRSRIFKVLTFTGLVFIACFTFSDALVGIVRSPIEKLVPNLVYTTLTEPFNVSMKMAFIAAVFLTSPFIMAQVWLFISPGLYKHERRYAVPFILFASLLFVTGGVFGYFVAFPYTLTFLVQWGAGLGLQPMLSIREYFDLFIVMELALGIVFEIPAVIFVLSRIGLVSAGMLLRNTKYAVLIACVLAAVITPSGDIPTMMVFALPMVLLYLLGVVIAFLFGKKRRKEPGD